MKNDFNDVQNLDSLLENFLQEAPIEDQDFSYRVMQSLPTPSRWSWMVDVLPSFLLSAILFCGWHYHKIVVQSFFMYRAEFYGWLRDQVPSFSISMSYGTLAGLAALVFFIVMDKVTGEIHSK